MDQTVISVDTLDALNEAILKVNGAASGAFRIKLTADIICGTATGGRQSAEAINLADGVTLTVDGSNETGPDFVLDGRVNGDGAPVHRGLCVFAGEVRVSDLTF